MTVSLLHVGVTWEGDKEGMEKTMKGRIERKKRERESWGGRKMMTNFAERGRNKTGRRKK